VVHTRAGYQTSGFGLIIGYSLVPMLLTWGMNLIVFQRLRRRLAASTAGDVAIRQAFAGALVFVGLVIVERYASHFAPVALIVLPLGITYAIYRYFGGPRATLNSG
jgi:hypothetical protein